MLLKKNVGHHFGLSQVLETFVTSLFLCFALFSFTFLRWSAYQKKSFEMMVLFFFKKKLFLRHALHTRSFTFLLEFRVHSRKGKRERGESFFCCLDRRENWSVRRRKPKSFSPPLTLAYKKRTKISMASVREAEVKKKSSLKWSTRVSKKVQFWCFLLGKQSLYSTPKKN